MAKPRPKPKPKGPRYEFGAQEPRIKIIPEGIDHPKLDEIREFVDALGVELDPWQWLVLQTALMRSGSVWAAFTVAACVPRQNGKNGILEIRELLGPLLLGEKLLIHTAHLADTSKEAFRRLDDLIDANDWVSRQVKHVWRTNGHESIEFKGGNRIRFRTRTRGGGRGFSGSPVFFDESMFLPDVSMGAILPVISAQPDPQIWYMGSAVDQQVMEDGVVFARVRERALGGDSERLAYLEWSLDVAKPDEVADEESSDSASWAATNPAFGIRIMPDYVKVEREELDGRTFAVERLGVGDWPDAGAKKHVIDLEKWDELVDVASKPVDPIVFAVDVAPNRAFASIAVAALREDGLGHIEIVDRQRGTAWVEPRLLELNSAHSPIAFVCDGASPAASLIPELEQAGLTMMVTGASDLAAACGLFYDAVEAEGIRHLATGELRSAIKSAAQRPLGDAWAWSRKNSVGDITALVSATLAWWGISTRETAETFALAW